MDNPRTFKETLYPHYGQSFTINSVLWSAPSEHQHLDVLDTPALGRVLVLDGVVQTTEKDEFFYHEAFAHVPILSHGAAKKVAVIGGGDGGLIREVLRHESVAEAHMVEIDSSVVDLCKEYFPNHSAGAFDDPRLTLHFSDGATFLNTTEEKFDIILVDSTDPIGPGESLFTTAFYAAAKRCLAPGGIFVSQNGVPFMQMDEVTNTAVRLGRYFTDVTFYTVAVPTYVGGVMTLAWATDSDARTTPASVLKERLAAADLKGLRYYTTDIHVAAFALPKYVLDKLDEAAAEAAAAAAAEPTPQ
jgi:spermidine synthase